MSVPGHIGKYEASNLGNVRSLDRYANVRGGALALRHGRVLKPWSSTSGHLMLCLGGHKKVGVHRIILQTFVGPAPIGTEACHKNGDPKDNNIENLRWDTRRENNLDRVRLGTHHYSKRDSCIRGHEYTQENTYLRTRNGNVSRVCRTCKRDNERFHKCQVDSGL